MIISLYVLRSFTGSYSYRRSWLLKFICSVILALRVDIVNIAYLYLLCRCVCPSVRPSVCPSVRLSVCPSVRLSVCPSWSPARCENASLTAEYTYRWRRLALCNRFEMVKADIVYSSRPVHLYCSNSIVVAFVSIRFHTAVFLTTVERFMLRTSRKVIS